MEITIHFLLLSLLVYYGGRGDMCTLEDTAYLKHLYYIAPLRSLADQFLLIYLAY